MTTICNAVATQATGNSASWLQQASQIMIGQCTPYLSGTSYFQQSAANGNLWQIGSTQAIAYTVGTNNYISIIAYVATTTSTPTNMCSGSIAYIKTYLNPTANTATTCVSNFDATFNTAATMINIYTGSYSLASGVTGVVVNT